MDETKLFVYITLVNIAPFCTKAQPALVTDYMNKASVSENPLYNCVTENMFVCVSVFLNALVRNVTIFDLGAKVLDCRNDHL